LLRIGIRAYRKLPYFQPLSHALGRALSLYNRATGRETTFVCDTGSFRIHIDLEQSIDCSIYYTGLYEAPVVETMRRLIPAGGIAIDVGAHSGYHTLTMATCVGPKGRVIGFEPTAWAYERLRANVELNWNAMPQIQVLHLGLSNEVAENKPMPVLCGYRVDGKLVSAQDVLSFTALDRHVADYSLPRIDFIKCDTDGWEAHVFEGAAKTLDRFHPTIEFELHPDALALAGRSAEELLVMLKDHGYRFFRPGTLQEFAGLEDMVPSLARAQRKVDVVAIAEKGPGLRKDATE
jgi:FkbM family methyltransferase